MFVKEFTNGKITNNNNGVSDNESDFHGDHVVPDATVFDPSYDEIMLDLDIISKCCPPVCYRNSEVKELPLNILIKTVETWLEAISNDNVGKICDCVTRSDSVFSGTSIPDSGYSGSTRPSSVVSVGDSVTSAKTSCSFNDSCDGFSNTNSLDCGVGRRESRSSSFGSARAKSVTFEDSLDEDVPKEYLELVTLHLPIILRFCLTCPCADVRKKCQYILQAVRNRGLPVPVAIISGPSAHVPPNELPFLGTCTEKTHTLFADAFLQNNRLDHVSQVMGYHPSYLEHFLRTQNFILRQDGPLPFVYRHYIAIMAAGRHQCSYLINLQKHEFLRQGGDQNWLRGLNSVPQKLRNLYDINKILAHRPWLLKMSHIEKLTKGKDSWSLAEVVHAIVILTHFHSLCSFVFSCGVNQELDQSGGYEYLCSVVGGGNGKKENISSATSNSKEISSVHTTQEDWKENIGPCPPSPTEPEVGITTLMQRMKMLSEQSEECTPVELAKRFENIESQSAEIGVIGAEPQETPADVSYFVEDAGFKYQDFAKRAEADIHTFRVQDYSWDDHGYSLVNRLYNEVGTLLDDKFRNAYNLTYYTMGGRTDVDTSRFRRAIWNYIQALFGIRHDDYDYAEINALLEKSLKSFIKSVCCYPERVTKKDYDRVLREFKHSEKVHVNLMILESRMQAELIYALRTVNTYMTN